MGGGRGGRWLKQGGGRARREGKEPIHKDLLEYVSSHGGTGYSMVEEGGIRYRWMTGNWERSVRKRGQRGRERARREAGRREAEEGGRGSAEGRRGRRDGEGRHGREAEGDREAE